MVGSHRQRGDCPARDEGGRSLFRARRGNRCARLPNSFQSFALFTGAAVYITFIEHPARMQCGVEIAVTEFAPSYRRATVMQATCAAVGLLSSLAAWLAGATVWWLIAGVLLGLVIPFTLIAILLTNKRLLSRALDRRSAEAERLLAHWGRLHAVRSVLSGLALLLFLYLAVFRKAI